MAVATFTSLSSAPLLCLALQIALITTEWVTRNVKDRVPLACVLLVGLYLGLSIFATRSPITILATSLTLDSWTGYYRLMIWENGLTSIWQHPLIGIGLSDWTRPWWMIADTVDALWLVIAMRTGIPAVALAGLAILLLSIAVGKATYSRQDRHLAQLATGWIISIWALVLVGFTVHYWNVLYTAFFFFLGLGGWIADPIGGRRQVGRYRSWRTAGHPRHAREPRHAPRPAPT